MFTSIHQQRTAIVDVFSLVDRRQRTCVSELTSLDRLSIGYLIELTAGNDLRESLDAIL